MKSLYESLLDDEEEVIKRTGINIFSDLYSAKTKKDFYKYVDMIFDLCTKVNSAEEMQQYKKSFFITELFGAVTSEPIGIAVDKAMSKTKKAVTSRVYKSVDKVVSFVSKYGKIRFGQGHRISGYDQHEDIYVMPKYLEDQFIECLNAHSDNIFMENAYGKPVKNLINKIS